MVFTGVFRGMIGKEPTPRDMADFANMEPTVEGVAKFVGEILKRGSSDDDWFKSFLKQHGFVKILLEEIVSNGETGINNKGSNR